LRKSSYTPHVGFFSDWLYLPLAFFLFVCARDNTINICKHTFISVFMHTHLRYFLYLCVRRKMIYTHVNVNLRLHVYTCEHTCCTYTAMGVCMCTYMYVHIYTDKAIKQKKERARDSKACAGDSDRKRERASKRHITSLNGARIQDHTRLYFWLFTYKYMYILRYRKSRID